MREIAAIEAETTLATLLDLVEDGEEVVITRHGKPVARLVPEHGAVDRDKARQAVADIIRLRRNVTLGDGISIRELIDEGRR